MTDPGIPELVLVCLAACCAVMALVWLWAHRIRNAGVVDIFWSYNFPLIALILFFLAGGYFPRKALICGMMFLEGLRLGTHLLTRVTAHLAEEEGRYQQLRKEWAPNAEKRFFWFFQFQGISNVLLAAPLFISAVNPGQELSLFEYAGATIWLLAFMGESIADGQLKAFKNDPVNKGKVCDKGLWNYSRHPNYFFQWLTWTGYFIFALGSPCGWLAVIAPAAILYLLLKVTGIPATEEQALRSKGDAYKKYQESTSPFIPWFKKN